MLGVKIHIVLRVMRPCSLVGGYQCFGGTYCRHLKDLSEAIIDAVSRRLGAGFLPRGPGFNSPVYSCAVGGGRGGAEAGFTTSFFRFLLLIISSLPHMRAIAPATQHIIISSRGLHPRSGT
jgi:hypothetical protein